MADDYLDRISGISNQDNYLDVQAGIVAEPKAKAKGQKTAGGFMGNIVSDVAESAKGLYNVVRHPIQTAQGIGTLAVGASEAAQRGLGLLNYPETPNAAMARQVLKPLTESVKDPASIPGRLVDYAYEKPFSTAMNLSAGLGVAGKALQTGGMVKTAQTLSKASELTNPVSVASKGISAAIRKGSKAVSPTMTKETAIGQVLQGRTKDISKGDKALAVIDTKGVKTYSDLGRKLNDKIPDLAKQVDAELAKDSNIYTLNDLTTTTKTIGGQAISKNYVEDSLKHLKELYEKINDPTEAANMDELLQKATTTGLTRKEVNDIARKYGYEFKDRAFNKSTGDPLTSVNAQSFENVRKGLKEVSRRGLSDEAKNLDETLSNVYNTKRLIEKNIEAANRLRQKIDERGIGEKIGRKAWDAIDAVTLGTVKGALLRAFPRGLGYKTKNYLDLEQSLERNLRIINGEMTRIEKITKPIGKALKNPNVSQVPFQIQQAASVTKQ